MAEIDYKKYNITPVEDNTSSSNEVNYKKYNIQPVSGNENTLPKALFNIAKEGMNIEPLTNIAKDVGGIIKGIPKAGVEAVGKIPEVYPYLKKNIPEASQQILNNPSRAGRNAIAGIAELGGQVSRIPPALNEYLAKIGMIKPEHGNALPKPFSEEEVKEWANQFVGGDKQPGDEPIRGGFRNIPSLYGGAKIAQAVNPLRYTKENIAKNVLNAEKKQMERHTKAYNKLWDEADRSGINNVKFDPNKININTIKKFPNDDYYISLENFLKNPTLENAHTAQSDLGKMARKLKKNPNLVQPSEANHMKNAALEAQKYIKSNMFKDANGKLDKTLHNKYNLITKSYKENVIPYKSNKALQAYKSEDITLSELIPALSKGRFSRKKSGTHPEIAVRKMLTENLGNKLGFAGLTTGAYALIDKLLNK